MFPAISWVSKEFRAGCPFINPVTRTGKLHCFNAPAQANLTRIISPTQKQNHLRSARDSKQVLGTNHREDSESRIDATTPQTFHERRKPKRIPVSALIHIALWTIIVKLRLGDQSLVLLLSLDERFLEEVCVLGVGKSDSQSLGLGLTLTNIS